MSLSKIEISTIYFYVVFLLSLQSAYQQAPCNQLPLFCASGYTYQNGICMPNTMTQCNRGSIFINGQCQSMSQLPTNPCPYGYYYSNNMCVPTMPCAAVPPIVQQPATTAAPPLVTTLTPTPTTIASIPVIPTTEVPVFVLPPEEIVRCPLESVLIDGECRKLVCPNGELYRGRCLRPICPDGTVWRGHRCQPPNFVTTILEIENVFLNKARSKPGVLQKINVNKKEYHTEKPTTEKYIAKTTQRPAFRKTTTTPPPANISMNGDCCTILTPRICKLYGEKWICFNRRSRRCDSKLCKYPLIYLKIPKVIYEPPVLFMPPNPPLEACSTPECDNGPTVDCSGCAHNIRARCSPNCYNYNCPNRACSFIDMQDYCSNYPSEFGCTSEYGCIWNWCEKS